MKKLISVFIVMLLTTVSAMADQYCFWGYATSTMNRTLSTQTSGKGAIYVPAEVAQRYKGCTISKVRVSLFAKVSTLKVFVTDDLNAETYDVQGEKTSGVYRGQNDVTTTKAYTIGDEGFYVGYEYKGDAASMAVSNTYSDNGCWANLGDGWKNYATSEGQNCLCIDAEIHGASLPTDVKMVACNGGVGAVGQPFEINALVKNQGNSRINSMCVEYSIDGSDYVQANLTKVLLYAGADKTISVPVADNTYSLGLHDVKMRIVSINGKADDVTDNNDGEAQLNIMQQMPVKRMFVEEKTGVNCGFCPMGIAGFNAMEEEHPSSFVGVAVHCYDNYGPVAPTDYSAYVESLMTDGFPACSVQRMQPTKPSPDQLEIYWKAITSTVPDVTLEVESNLSSDKRYVEATTSLTPVVLKRGAEYKLGFILTEDNVSGYTQMNNYSGGTYGKMGGFENMGSYLSIDLQHVVRGTYGYEGIDESVPKALTVNKVETYTAKMEIPSTVSNRNNLNVVAILIDSSTGYVENAAIARVGSSSTTAIQCVDTDASVLPDVRIVDGTVKAEGFNGKLKVYNLNGEQVSPTGLPHGMYIIKGEGETPFAIRMAY